MKTVPNRRARIVRTGAALTLMVVLSTSAAVIAPEMAQAGNCVSCDNARYNGELPDVVYRVGKVSTPAEVFVDGFRSYGQNPDVLRHALATLPQDSIYISTTSSASAATRIANRYLQMGYQPWIYTITTGADLYNLEASLERLERAADRVAISYQPDNTARAQWSAYANQLGTAARNANYQREWVSASRIRGSRILDARRYSSPLPDGADFRQYSPTETRQNPAAELTGYPPSRLLIGTIPECPPDLPASGN